jgi:hypothetical protein
MQLLDYLIVTPMITLGFASSSCIELTIATPGVDNQPRNWRRRALSSIPVLLKSGGSVWQISDVRGSRAAA